MPAIEPTLQRMLWPGDGRSMLRLHDGLWVDERAVTGADYARFLAATGHPVPRGWRDGRPPPGREDRPVVNVDIEDARAFARWANKRLPLQREWQRAVATVDFHTHLDGGHVWEWTGSPHRDGHVVRGGPYRNQPGVRGGARHRSWEDTGAVDLGFRCVADDGLRTLPVPSTTSIDGDDDGDDDVKLDAGVDGIVATPRGIALVGGGHVVHVDVVTHELLLRSPGVRRRCGLTSAGLLQAVRLAWRLSAQRHPEPAILRAVDEAVRRHALRVRPELAAVGAADGVGDGPLPLVWSRGVVLRPHVVKDLLRLRPVRVALRMLDSRDDSDDTSPEYAALLAETVVDWQRLFTHPASTPRSVNRTLALHGDDATPSALQGLRDLVLTAPITSLPHLEVLSHLAGVPQPAAEFILRREIVEKASGTELGEALVLVDEGEVLAREQGQAPAARLAEIVCALSAVELRDRYGRRPRFREIVEEALHALRHVLRLKTEVVAPPIPPPPVRGVRFLSTVAEIVEEGVLMNHCVATRAPLALAGQSFLFHVSHEGESATAEVLATGEVVEVRGPHNTSNGAVRLARRVLKSWGRLVPLVATPLPPWPRGVEPARAGLVKVTDVRGLAGIVQALTAEPHGGDRDLVDFVLELVADVHRGTALIAHDDVGKALWRLDRQGQPLRSSAALVGDAENPWDDDEEEGCPWDLRT